jgi:hypothetical protein
MAASVLGRLGPEGVKAASPALVEMIKDGDLNARNRPSRWSGTCRAST